MSSRRLQIISGGVKFAMQAWVVFSRLSHLKKPFELYIPLRLAEGTHNLQNPGQLKAPAGGALDWFDFWLNGHEDPAPEKAGQYVRWRRLRALHEADLEKVKTIRSGSDRL